VVVFTIRGIISHSPGARVMQKLSNRVRRGFTLIEVLIVVVILGILAATVLPQFASSTANAKESSLRADLSQIRAQIQLYKFQHDGNLPGGTATNVINQLTMATDINGNTAAVGTAGYPYGPYLMGQLPTNPYAGGNGLMVSAAALTASNVDTTQMQGTAKVGWIYSTLTGQVMSNTTGNTADGTTPLSSL
jgi:prepilin-type N-terminal cleavage/methylation domain-containing protein